MYGAHERVHALACSPALRRLGLLYEESAIAWNKVPISLRQLWRQRYRWCYGTLQAVWKHRGALLGTGPAGRF
ncbi:hypothetical protein GCM10010104_35690 [Streptomyces indiaensis]|uniref:Uncharacterized protein n=1 Tax=Streptomyces indiaensis TaxID=284033 RepID=A0ABN3DQJ4_9ACTN